MLERIPWKTTFLYASVLLLGILIGPILSNYSAVTRLVGQPGNAMAQEAIPAAAADPSSPEATYICTPYYIGSFSNRVHVLCTAPASGGINYFASPTSDSKMAARVLSIMLTAKSLGKNLQIYYSATGNGTAYGCAYSDCRPITAIEMTN